MSGARGERQILMVVGKKDGRRENDKTRRQPHGSER
jgi:hypothetical protein